MKPTFPKLAALLTALTLILGACTSPPSPVPSATPSPSSLTFDGTPTPQLVIQPAPGGGGAPTLEDLWEERASFEMDVEDTGLPMGESDTVVKSNGELWSYLHASDPSAGVVDRCGDPVPFPGCTVLYRSHDGGRTFHHDDPPVCLFECASCPCSSELDHIDQQQYPQVAYDGETLLLVYEYRGKVHLRRSQNGLTWSMPEQFIYSSIWKRWLRGCYPEERIGHHPFVPYDYECLAGGPPGILIDGGRVYVFMALGQNPSSMGCYVGDPDTPASDYERCQRNPLFTGALEYGPLEAYGPDANPYFDFRTISSAEPQRIGERVYMLYEGVRGPGPGDAGDTQFGLGLARTVTERVDGPWETYPGNPILVDLPGNVGLGHADLMVLDGRTYLYTSLDGEKRSRLVLVWDEER